MFLPKRSRTVTQELRAAKARRFEKRSRRLAVWFLLIGGLGAPVMLLLAWLLLRR